MARQERPKEDLVRDATAFAVRVEFRRSDDDPNWVFVGLRPDGGGAIYFGEDEFYAFNAKGELRRAFRDGRLLKAESGRLAEMVRERTAEETALFVTMLSPDDQARFLRTVEVLVQGAAKAVGGGWFLFARSAGETASDVVQVRDWLVSLAERPIAVAQRPNAIE